MERDVDLKRAPSGVFDSVRHLLASIAAHLHTRLELFSIELAEEKQRLITLLCHVVTALFLFCATVALTMLLIIAAYWDTPYRLYVIGSLALLVLIATYVVFAKVRDQLRSGPRLFEASLHELYKDRQHLDSQR